MSYHEEEQQLGRIYDHRLVKKLWPFLAKYKGKLVVIAGAASLMVCCQVAWPRIFADIAVAAVDPEKSSQLWILIAVFGVAVLLGALADFICTYLSDSTSQRLVTDIRAKLYLGFQELPLSYFDRIPSGKVLSRLQNDPDTLVDLLEVGFVTVVRNSLLMLALAVSMLLLDWKMALAAFGAVPVVIIISLLYRPLMRRAFRRVRRLVSQLNARIEENISGHSTVLVLNQEQRCLAELDAANMDLCKARQKTAILHAMFPPWLHAAFGVGLALVLYYGGVRVMGGDLTLKKNLITFIIYMQMFGWPLQEMMERLQILQAAMAALERIFGFLENEGSDLVAPAATSGQGLISGESSEGQLEFKDVWFAYRGEEWILKGLSFKVAPSERVAIAGPTGSGKTTILSLASVLYRPQKGRILLNGRDLSELDPGFVRRQVATVMQDVFLFSESILENVRLWNNEISEEEVRLACKRAHAAGFIEKYQDAYKHVLGQRGSGLSAGERQLISFARALAYDPQVLILDEATSSVDAQTEESIRQGLFELTKNRTSIIVAHRFSTLADADRLLVVQDGVIDRETTPAEFLASREVPGG